LTIIVGLVVTVSCLLGGFAAMGGKVSVIWQPWEYVIIGGSALGIFIFANTMSTIKDAGRATMEAFRNAVPKTRDYLDVLGLLFVLMRELRGKARNEVEGHIEAPNESAIFQKFPAVLADPDLSHFICDYVRLYIIGNARTHEIEALMDEEIQTIMRDKLKSYSALAGIADGLPALGIVAAVLGVIKAMGALDQSPDLLGKLIGAALVGSPSRFLEVTNRLPQISASGPSGPSPCCARAQCASRRACQKPGIARILADSSHRIGPPITPERHIEPDPVALLRQIFGEVCAHAKQHFKFKLVPLPTGGLRPHHGMSVQLVVMGGDDGIESAIPGLRR